MADTNTDRTGPKTPSPSSTFSLAPELKSTPNAAGSAVISEHLKTLGVHRCEVDTMLEELTYACLDPSKPLPNVSKSSLLDACLHAVLPICNDSTIQANLSAFVAPQVETKSYTPFVGAANQSLLRLSELDVPGLAVSKDDKDLSDILFHHSDHPMFQTHQGETSERKPDVVIIAWKTARTARNNDMYLHCETACAKPDNNFKWPETLSKVEFKRTRSSLDAPPSGYEVRDYNVPTSHQYMEYRKETPKPAEATGSRPVPAPAPQSSNERKRESVRLKLQGKRPSDNALPNQPENKRAKSKNEKPEDDDNEKEKNIEPIVQNGLYAAEMFAPHVARRHVISFAVNDDVIYVWYFDGKNAIQCSGINFVQDLPRFLVLLLALQRMPHAQWSHNPLFEPEPGVLGGVKIKDEEMEIVDLKFKLQSKERMTHFGMRGRATTVYPVESERLLTLLQEKPSQNSISPEHRGDKKFCSRYHWRLIVKPYGEPPSHFKSRKELICAFRDFVVAHSDAMTKVQVLHGDLSANNFILHEGTGYLIDFDHAAILEEGSTSISSFGTGTTMPYSSLRILSLQIMAENVDIVKKRRFKAINSHPYHACYWGKGSYPIVYGGRREYPTTLQNLNPSSRSGAVYFGHQRGHYP